MNRIISLLLGVAIGLLSLSSQAADVSTASAVKALSESLKGLKSMHADFEQWVMDAKQNQLQYLNGEVWVQRPGQFRWDTEEPYPQQILATDNELWIYDQDLEQAVRRQLDQQLGNTPALLLSEEPEKMMAGFSISGYRFEETGEWRFDLTPKDENVMFTLLRVHFLEGEIRDMYLEDNLGQTTRIAFKIKSKNKPLAGEVFRLNLTDSVDIIEES